MAQEHKLGFVRTLPSGAESDFAYVGAFLPLAEMPADELRHRIETGETPGANGEYQSPLVTLDARTLSLRWDMDPSPSDITAGTDLTGLQDNLDALFAAHPVGSIGRLYRKIVDTNTGNVLRHRYLRCRVAARIRGQEQGFAYNQPEVQFRAGRPLWEEGDVTGTSMPRSQSLGTASATIAVTPGGVEKVQPVFTLAVTHVGTITITESLTGKSIALAATATGTYILDASSDPPTATKSSLSVLEMVSGEFFEMFPDAQNLTIALSGGATLSSSSVAWRRRYTHV